MNGREIEHLLAAMDATIDDGRESWRRETVDYLLSHQQEVMNSLQSSGTVNVPTASGSILLQLTELQALVA